MTNPREDWMTITTTNGRFDPADLARKAGEFDRSIRWRNLREYAASGFVVALFGYWATRAEGPAETVAMVLVALGALVAALNIMRLGTPIRPRADQPASAGLSDWRAELERQATLLEGIRRNYLAPFVPGFALLAVAPLIDGTTPSGGGIVVAGFMLVVFGGVLWFVDRLNRRAAAELRATIAKLD